MHPITLGPFTGTATHERMEDEFRRELREAQRYAEQHGVEQGSGEASMLTARVMATLEELHGQYTAVNYHNTLLPFVVRLGFAREATDQALAQVEKAWAALRTAREWYAAHHRYVETVHAAREAIGAWSAAASELVEKESAVRGELGAPSVEQYYLALVDQADRITIEADTMTAPSLALTELEETYARRRTITDETLKRPTTE